MSKQWLDGMWDHMRQKYGVYLRALDTIPADRFGDHPVPGMRTPTELVAHTSGAIVRDIAEGVASGAIAGDVPGEAELTQSLRSKEDVIGFARECWAQADSAMATVGDTKWVGEVGNQWGMTITGTFEMVILNDEVLDHRGQFYAYARACGEEPRFMWDFGHNEEGFQPSETA